MDEAPSLFLAVACLVCGAPFQVKRDEVPPHGLKAPCPQCHTLLPVFQPDRYYLEHFSIELAQFFIQRKIDRNLAQLERDHTLLLHFEKLVKKNKKGLRFSDRHDVEAFFALLRQNQLTDEQIVQVRRLLDGFYRLLHERGIIQDHPLHPGGIPPPLPEPEPAAAGESAIQAEDNRRQFPRRHMRGKALVTTRRGHEFFGETLDLSFEGALLRACGPKPPIARGDACALRVSLVDFKPMDFAFVSFPCQVMRIDQEMLGLRLLLAGELGKEWSPRFTGCPVVMRRSSGELESGWEIVPFGAELPANIQEQVIRFQVRGFPVVCSRPDPGGSTPIYKVVAIHDLKKYQEAACQP